MLLRYCIGILLIYIPPSLAFAYVDPGIIGALWQWLYVLVIGAVGAWVMRPWTYIKSFFVKQEKVDSPENDDNN